MPRRTGIDPRSRRFAAALTSVLLIGVLLTGNGWLALAQWVVFAIGAVNLRYAPYGLLYRTVVAPRLARPTDLEPAEPVRFSQLVGAVFLFVAVVAYLGGAPLVGAVAAGAALIAALLNAVLGLCLGCEAYLLFFRLRGAGR